MKPELTAQILGMYLDRECDVLNADGEYQFQGIISLASLSEWYLNGYKAKPHLRRLEIITEEECREMYKIESGNDWSANCRCKDYWWHYGEEWYTRNNELFIGKSEIWLYLLSRGFDLFGLIEAGLAKEVSE